MLTVLDALLWRQAAAAAAAELSPSTYRTFTIPLSPSCKAIIQVETRSLCAHGMLTVLDALLWRQAAATAAVVFSPST